MSHPNIIIFLHIRVLASKDEPKLGSELVLARVSARHKLRLGHTTVRVLINPIFLNE